jgi:hypothetical protein
LNNYPTNLSLLSDKEHTRAHSIDKRENVREAMRAGYYRDLEKNAKEHSERIKRLWAEGKM